MIDRLQKIVADYQVGIDNYLALQVRIRAEIEQLENCCREIGEQVATLNALLARADEFYRELLAEDLSGEEWKTGDGGNLDA